MPKPVFTDAEAGAKEFPDSDRAHGYNYYTPAKRKQTHYEDVTVEVQPDPRHYLSQGWLYGFSDGRGGYPLDWTALKAWGSDRPEPERCPGSGGKGYDWPAPRLARVPRPERGVGAHPLPLQRQRRPAAQPEHRGGPAGQGVRPVEPELGATSSSATSAPGCTSTTASASTCSPTPTAARPTNMHNNAISVNSMHRIRFAQDLALYNLTLTEEIDGLRRHRAPRDVEQRPGLAGRPRGRRAADRDRRLVRGDLRRQRRVRAAGRRAVPQPAWCSRRRRATATSSPRRSIGAEEYDYAERDLRYTMAMFELLTNDREFADHNKEIMQGWLSTWVPRCHRGGPRRCSRCGRSPTPSRRASRTASTAAKNRFTGILSDLGPATHRRS